MKIKSIKVIDGKNKWSESKDKLIHMVLDLGVYENKPSNKIEGFYERIKEHLPSLQSHRCSEGKAGGFFKRIKEGTWMGHIIEHVALELQTLAGYDTGWGRTRGVKGQKGVYNVVFNYVDEECGKLAAREAYNVVNDIINDKDPQIDKIIKKLKPKKQIRESIRRILREEENEMETTLYNIFGEYPDEDELIWNYVGQLDFKKLKFPIKRVDIRDLVNKDFIENFKSNAESWQKKYVKHITKNIDKFNHIPIIVDFDNNIIIDGNHRLMGMYLSDVKYVYVVDINDTNLQESIRKVLREEFNQLPKYLYHLTSDENYKNILMEGGLNPKYSKQSKRKKGIYLSDDISVAENYRFFYEPNEKVVLLKIKTSSLNEDLFYPDDYELQDFLDDGGWGVDEDIEYSRWYDVPWQLSLKWVNQIQYLEPIPISEIKKI